MRVYRIVIALVFILALSGAAFAQSPKTPVFQLGNQATYIPAPAGFEEAASRSERIREHFSTTESPDNDMLAIFLPQADCEKLRSGAFRSFNFYAKVSVRRAIREESYSSARFAELVSTFRQNEATILDMKRPAMQAALRRLNKGISDLANQETHVELPQLVKLGEFDTRPNVYALMLLMNLTTTSGDEAATTHILGGLSYVRVKDRVIYVYTYRTYTSQDDINVLRDFTRQWLTQILAAN